MAPCVEQCLDIAAGTGEQCGEQAGTSGHIWEFVPRFLCLRTESPHADRHRMQESHLPAWQVEASGDRWWGPLLGGFPSGVEALVLEVLPGRQGISDGAWQLPRSHVKGGTNRTRRCAEGTASWHESGAATPGRQTGEGDQQRHDVRGCCPGVPRPQAPGCSSSHAKQWLRCMEKDLFPWVGSLPLTEVSAPLLLQTLRRVEARGVTQMPHDLREWAGQVFKHGIATGRCERNPAAALVGTLTPHTVKHAAAVLEPSEVGALLRGMEAYVGHPYTRAALVLSALLFQRPGNLRAMEWAEVDANAALWTIPSDKMKRRKEGKLNGRPHLVPLAPQALALLEDVRPLTGHGRFVFPSLLTGERCMSDNTIRTALRRMGYSNDDMSAHGFRAMARTLIAERLPGISIDVVEAQLAHGKSGPLGMAYDRAEYMEQRRSMMKAWADYLDTLRAGAQIIPFKVA